MIAADQPVRWGVLGAGAIAATVSADLAALPGHVLQAVGARDGDRAAAFARQHGVARSYGSYAELVADPDVDVVYVATTHAQHHEHALLCLRAGKPVLVEKAFTLNAAQAAEVAAEARARGLFAMEAMWVRFHPLVRRVSQLLADGAIGSVIGVRADLSKRFTFDPSHRLFDLAAGGGALLDLGVYPAAVTWTWLGRPATVQATGSLSPTGSDLSAALQWGYPDGRVAQIYTSAAGDSPFAALVTGTDGWIALEPRIHRGRRVVVHSSAGDEQIDAPTIEGNGYRAELEEVARCLRAGETESPVVPLSDTIGILETLDEARRQLGVRYLADG
ncbi:Gfo/Idh/MocA family protein [uncultured Jatrophihabitans sp.]|uniref:Gfo/Idh/MocA family protein n=1 Tax=uncultured Jatrophihabitans sp. TaxID=1610747 RepID=UPI0035C98075